MSDPAYTQQANEWYQDGYTYGYNQMQQVWMDGGPTGITCITEPYNIPPQWQQVYHEGMDAGSGAADNQWSSGPGGLC